MKKVLCIPTILLLAAAAIAQTAPAPAAPAPLHQSRTRSAVRLRDILPNRQKNTIAAIEAMPADKFSFKPTADQNTFGHLVAHMIETNNLLCSKAGERPGSEGRRSERGRRKRQTGRSAQSFV